MSDQNGRYNADELHAPDWLNENFFTELLRKKENDENLKISKINISPGTGKSDHYASIMFRVKINYLLSNKKEKNISMIIKTTPFVEGQKKDLLDKFVLFETEIKMYSDILPKIEEILKSHGDETKLAANLLYSSLTPNKCLIFEDLCELGYTTIQGRHMNMVEAKMALLKLAKLHAVSYKLAKEGNTSITTLKDGSFNDNKIKDFQLVADTVKTIKKVLAKYSDLAHFVTHFEKIENKLIDRIIDSYNTYQNGDREGIFVVNHGDFHMKNMMIKTKDGKLQDLLLCDYQISVFSSAALDIMYAFVMTFSPEMRLKHRDELNYYYFSNFQKTLKLIGYKGYIPKMLDFQKELLKHGHFELFLVVSFIIFNYVFIDPDGDIGKSVEDENFRLEFLQKPEVIEELRILLPQYLHKGYFDF